MTLVELTAYDDVDLAFSRGETPAFRLEFTGVTADEVTGWVLTAPIRRSSMAEPVAYWTVTVNATTVTFSLPTDVTETLPDRTTYTVRLQNGDSVRIPMGGRLFLRDQEVC